MAHDSDLVSIESDEDGVDGVTAEIEARTCTRIQLTLENLALITGCITEGWGKTPNSGDCASSGSAEALCNPLSLGSHTVCTQSGYESTSVFADAANIPAAT